MKKFLFTFLIFTFCHVLVSAQSAVNETDVKGNKQGFWEEKTPAGTAKGNYKNNQKDGCWAAYSADGKLIRIENFEKGARNGITVEIDQRGYLVSETYYLNDLIEGTAKKYFYGTNPASMIDYAHGKMNGKKRLYYENSAGKMMEESEYVDDMKNGPSRFYTLNEDLIAEYNYVSGALQGVQKSYFAGKKIMTEQEFDHNLENGFSKEYYENGKLKSEGSYLKGALNGVWKEYTDDGKLKVQGNYVNGLKEGKWIEFDAAGKIIKTSNFNGGQVK